MKECCFLNQLTNDCAALAVKKCEGCKWRKTQEEYNAGREKANEFLKRKGLEAHIVTIGKAKIVTTKKSEDLKCFSDQ